MTFLDEVNTMGKDIQSMLDELSTLIDYEYDYYSSIDTEFYLEELEG